MASIEDMLPPGVSLEYEIAENQEIIRDIFDRVQQQENDIIGIDYEIRRDIEVLDAFSGVMSDSVMHDEDHKLELKQTIYRSICFATQLADETLPEYYSCDVLEYIRSKDEQELLDGVIYDESERYLQDRPAVAGLIDHYTPQIDKSGRHDDVVKYFAGLVLKVAEQSVAEQQLDNQANYLSVKDFE